MEIYAFGSIMRGEIDELSDIDILVLKDIEELIPNIDKEKYSIYTYQRILQMWEEGNPFSWHLFSESKCLYHNNDNTNPFLETLGKPSQYTNMVFDLHKFHTLFKESVNSIHKGYDSVDFDLSMIFLAIRNFASCFSLGYLKKNEFSRDAAIKIEKYSIDIDISIYNRLKESRILATRGIGRSITDQELHIILNQLPKIEKWFVKLLNFVE